MFTARCKTITPLQRYSPRDFRSRDRKIDLFSEDSVHQNPTLTENIDFWSSFLKLTGIACGDDYRPRLPNVIAGADNLAVIDQSDRFLSRR